MNKKRILQIVLVLGIITIGVKTIAFTEPGSSTDPLVTLSYVEDRFTEIKRYIDERISNLNLENNSGTSNGVEDSSIKVVELTPGQSIIGEGGTEIILRAGSAVAIGSELGGVSDVTAGIDIDTNGEISKNHLLIIPRSDGRGVYSKNNTVFMVRGKYSIQ